MSCVPCPCDVFNLNPFACAAVMYNVQQPLYVGQVYGLGYELYNNSDKITEGLGNVITSDLGAWGTKIGLCVFVPWVIMFIIVFVMLGIVKVFSWEICIGFIVVSLLIAIIAMLVIYTVTEYAYPKVVKDFKAKVKENIKNNQEVLTNALLAGYNCAFCPSENTGCTETCLPQNFQTFEVKTEDIYSE